MKGFQSLFVLIEVLILVGAIFGCLYIGFYFLRKPHSAIRTSIIPAMGILVIFLMTLAYIAQSDFPVLNFIDRCLPNGTSLCVNGASFEQVRSEVLSDHIRLFIFL